METMESHPLVISLEHSEGQEVSLTIDPHDDFTAFLRKAKSALGYEIDIKSVAKDHQVSLTDNIYDFLLKTQASESEAPGFIEETPDGTEKDLTYVLGDGTMIHASQIHFDNEDPPVDLTAEDIPFIKYKDDDSFDETKVNIDDYEMKIYKVVDSPTKSSTSNPNYSFANNLPFQLICNNFETQFTKFVVESSGRAKSNVKKCPVNNNYHYEASKSKNYTREKVLDMFKDTPVDAKIVNTTGIADKRKHARKCDPTKFVQPQRNSNQTSYVDNKVTPVPKRQNCYVCGVIIEKDSDKVLLFNNEDQRHRIPNKQAPINVVCLQCLEDNYKPSQLQITPDPQYLDSNESFVKKEEKKIDNIPDVTKVTEEDKVIEIDIEEENFEDKKENFKVNATVTKESEVVTVDLDIDDVSNILQDEEVVQFLKKHDNEGGHDLKQLKCRFCEQVFQNITDLSVHAFEHRHVSDDGVVFPCPLCAYGYADFLWLKGHLKTAHEIKANDAEPAKTDASVDDAGKVDIENVVAETDTPKNKEKEGDVAESVPETTMKTSVNTDIVKIEVKEEIVDSSDEEIWIVQTRDDEADRQMEILIGAANKQNKRINQALAKNNDADNDEEYYTSSDKKLRCAKRHITTAEGNKGERSMGQGKKRKTKEAQVLTCHGCNEQFTSKVRLRFHLQFHDTTTNNNNLVSADGKYICASCPEISFETDSQLFDHLHFQHSRQKYWKCQFKGCGKIFHMRSTLTKHGRTHSDTRRYVCGTCGKKFFDKQTLDEHSVTHLKIKPYQCHICMKQLTRRSRLRMHLRAHMEEPSPRLVCACAVCAAAFKDTHHAQEHLINSPGCMQKYASQLKLEEIDTKQLSPTSGIVRTTVEVKIADPPSMSEPIKNQVDNAEATRLLSQLSPSARAVIRVVEIEKALRCEFCEQVFYTEEGLNKHRAIHKGVLNPYVCHICKVNFSTYSRCTTHKTTHGFFKRALCTKPSADGVGYGDFPVVKHFLCEDCGRTYLHWTYLQVHRRTKHVGHPCQHCHRVFPNSWTLGLHKKNECQDNVNVRLVTCDTRAVPNYGERYHRIQCRDCDEFLPNKTALYKHRKNVHSDMSLLDHTEYSRTDGALPSQSFINRQTAHENRQVSESKNPEDIYKYPEGQSVRNPSILTGQQGKQKCQPLKLSAVRNHQLIDTGVRAWQCSRCPNKFRIRSDLRVHERIKHYNHLDGSEHMEYPVAWSVSVIQMSGLEPSPQEVLNALAKHGVHSESVTHISRIAFGKGTSGIVPDRPQALKALQDDLAKKDTFRQSANTVIDLKRPKSVLTSNLTATSTSETNKGGRQREKEDTVSSVPKVIEVAPVQQANHSSAIPAKDAAQELQDL